MFVMSYTCKILAINELQTRQDLTLVYCNLNMGEQHFIKSQEKELQSAGFLIINCRCNNDALELGLQNRVNPSY